MKQWSCITNEADAKTAIIAVVGDIEPQTVKDFIEQLKTLGDKDLTLRINSYGGDYFSALGIYNMLRAHPGRVESFVDGIAASAASLIACAGRVKMPANTWMMIHQVSGNLDPQQLRKIENGMVAGYVGKTGLSESKIRALMSAETWMDAPQAVGLGFCDQITEPIPFALAAYADLGRFRNLPSLLKMVIAGEQRRAIYASWSNPRGLAIINRNIQKN